MWRKEVNPAFPHLEMQLYLKRFQEANRGVCATKLAINWKDNLDRLISISLTLNNYKDKILQ